MTRTLILDRLKKTLPTRGREQAAAAPAQRQRPFDQGDAVELFKRRWQAMGGTCEEYDSPTSARLAILLYLHEHDIDHLLSWEADQLAIPGLGDAFTDAGVIITAPDRRSLDPIIYLGLTGADAALADTGSLILVPEKGRSWLPALLPILHLVILPVSRLYPDLASWRRAWRQDGRLDELALSLIITGPSISDDIELHPHYGMFGPRQMHLFLVWDA